MIPEQVYKQLPDFLKDLCSHFSGRERDNFLTAVLGVISGMLRSVSGRYKNMILYPNFFVVICAPPASGKGVIAFAKLLVIPMHDLFTKKNDEMQEGKKKEDKTVVSLIIPADTSAGMFLELLKNNGGTGILIQTEIDTLVNSLRQDWGTFDDKLRASFHHEDISYARKGDNVSIDIKSPRISMVLAGTPGQVNRLFSSTENGLFSRNIFYVYSQDPVWEDVKPCYGCENLEEVIRKSGELLTTYVLQLEKHPMQFELTEGQWQTLNTHFTEQMEAQSLTHGDDARSVVARMGVIVFRIAMILSALRGFSTENNNAQLICSDVDFSAAMSLGKLYLEHAKVMMEGTPDSSVPEAKKHLQSFINLCPSSLHDQKRLGLAGV